MNQCIITNSSFTLITDDYVSYKCSTEIFTFKEYNKKIIFAIT